jgi:hypothetical protein
MCGGEVVRIDINYERLLRRSNLDLLIKTNTKVNTEAALAELTIDPINKRGESRLSRRKLNA